MTYLRYNVRSQIFAKSLPMIIVEGMMKTDGDAQNNAGTPQKVMAQCK